MFEVARFLVESTYILATLQRFELSLQGSPMTVPRRVLWLFGAALCLAAGVTAQVQTAELHVTVKDAHGAVVRSATVTVTDQARGLTRTSTVDAEGEYVFLSLPPGVYSVSVQAAGFAKLVKQDVRLQIGHVEQLPVLLSVAAATETVNVSWEAVLVEMQQSQSGTTISTTRIENLPINGRNYINFALTDSQLNRNPAPNVIAPTSALNDQHAFPIGDTNHSSVRPGFFHPGQTPRSDQLLPSRTRACVILFCGVRPRKSTERHNSCQRPNKLVLSCSIPPITIEAQSRGTPRFRSRLLTFIVFARAGCRSATCHLLQLFRVPSPFHFDLRAGAFDLTEICGRQFDGECSNVLVEA
jgi:hypothetical protein